jgi:hypothetical protein
MNQPRTNRYRVKAHTAWTDYEMRFLRNHAEYGARFIAARLKRTVNAVYRKASVMGVHLGRHERE